jgi:acyl-CoA synthetase (NDP forming)
MLAKTVRLAAPDRLRSFFAPRSLAIVGASENSFWSLNAFRNLRQLGFSGRIVPVNPKRKTVFGQGCLPSLRALTEPVDLAFVIAPTEAVPKVLDDAAAAGIRNAVIIAAGFGEIGGDGRRLQAELVDHAERAGITVLGPNCPGFLNTAASVSAYGQEIPTDLPRGGVAVLLQSGALASAVLKFSRAHGIGLSTVVCMGNEAVICAADVLEHLIDDASTRVIAMFLEQIRDGKRFVDLCRRALAAGKPIVVLKVGRTAAGQKVALAHTGALAGDEAVVDAALRQVGVIRVRGLEEMLITAGLLAQGPRLRGPRMAVLTTSGGACDIIADRASDEGLEMPPFAPDTAAVLGGYLPSFATVQNPLDGAAVDTMHETGSAAVPMDVVAEMVSRDPGFDFILYMGFNVVPLSEPPASARDKIAARMEHVSQLMRRSPVPIVAMSQTCLEVGAFARGLYNANDIFMLGGIEFGLSALGHAVRWEARRVQAETLAEIGASSSPAATDTDLAGAGPLSEWNARRILEAAGVPLVPATLATDADEAVRAAERHGFPVVLKICAAEIAHKSDVGGVALNLGDAAAVRAAFARIAQAGEQVAGAKIEGVLVSPMRPHGVELLVGITVDPNFGQVLAVGLGGIWVEILKDANLRLLPVARQDVMVMLRSLRSAAILDGARGGPAVDVERAADAIWRITQAARSLGPRLQALEVNPLWCHGARVEALDALVVRAEPCDDR